MPALRCDGNAVFRFISTDAGGSTDACDSTNAGEQHAGDQPADSAARPEVEFRQLRHFIALAEELHFGRAATRIFISQPGLSQSIAKLERTLNVQLLQRSKHEVRLTQAGAEFLRDARRMLTDMSYAVQRARSVGQGQPYVLRLGVALMAEQLIGPALAAFRGVQPGIVLDQINAVSERLLAQVAEGSLQVAIVHQVPELAEDDRVQWEVIRYGSLGVLLSRNHRLASRSGIGLEELHAEAFLVNPKAQAPSAYQGFVLMCATWGGFIPTVFESAVTSTPALDADWVAVREVGAVALAPWEIACAISPPDVVVVPLLPPPRDSLAMAWRCDDNSAQLEQFLTIIRSHRDANGWLADKP